jgi:hypothetical protein
MTGFHEEVLPTEQRRVLNKIGAWCKKRDFYLGGGTAVAIQLGHRRSLDLDWFSPAERFDSSALVQELRMDGIPIDVKEVGRGALHGLIDGVRVSFLRYRYPLLGDFIEWPEYRCRMACLDDLACMKLAAAAQRGEKKDFFDVVAICSGPVPFDRALELYSKKFAIKSIGHVLMSLCYFDDARTEESPELLSEMSWDEVQETLRAWVREKAG